MLICPFVYNPFCLNNLPNQKLSLYVGFTVPLDNNKCCVQNYKLSADKVSSINTAVCINMNIEPL